jgi:uncharacterized membrane protein
MNNKLSALLTTAIVSGLLASQSAKAEESANTKAAGDKTVAEKNTCKGEKGEGKNGCNQASKENHKKKQKDKNSCKNGCAESKEKEESK